MLCNSTFNQFKCLYLRLFLSLIFLFTSFLCLAQQGTPSNDTKPAFKVFYEKVYLHFDRNYYSAGDDIWFKAYLVNALSNYVMYTSANLYVDLISPDSKVADRKVIRLNDGIGNGDFKLHDSIPTGTWKIRAYTQWMRNFDDLFVFEKEIKILGISAKKIPNTDKAATPKPVIQFFPEGGALIGGVLNFVAFKAIDEFGNGCHAKGVIISSDGDTISWIESMHLGMGNFAFLPTEGKKYFASCILNNSFKVKTELAPILPVGFNLHVVDRDSRFVLSIATNAETFKEYSGKQMAIAARAHGKTNYSATFVLNSEKTDLVIPKEEFPNGISAITLYDSLLRPHAERLVYVAKSDSVKLTVTTGKSIYSPREKSTISVKVNNTSGKPIKTLLSLAVVDNTQVPENTGNIVSYLMLESEVKGKIEQPSIYFDPANPKRLKQLDLLLLTQGWRDFVWRRLRDTTYKIRYMVEPGITISGKVRQKFADKPLPGMNISSYIPGAAKNKIFSARTNEQGKFYMDGAEFYGFKNVIVTSRDDNGKKGGWLLLDSLFLSPIPTTLSIFANDTAIQKSPFAEESVSRKNTLRKYTLSDTIELEEVVVTAAKQKEEGQIKSHIIDGGHPDFVYTLGEEEHAFGDLGSFMMQKIPGARFPETTSPGDAYNRVMFNVYGTLQPPRFIVDGRRYEKGDSNDENYVYNIPITDIERIIVSKTDVLSGQGYVISIYTNPNAGAKKEFYTINTKLKGYYESRVFYSPDHSQPSLQPYKPDLRTTIYWAPNLTTDENGNCEVSFFNADKNADVRIVVEGLTERGALVTGRGRYSVK
jgi:hypothetical protein